MKFGIYFPQGGYGEYRNLDPEETTNRIKALASAVDELPFNNLWLYDHMFSYMNPYFPSFEAWTLLSYLAPITRNVRLGTLVSSEPFRNPGLLAKIVASLDVLSGGRMNLGLGAGWEKNEMEAYGFEFVEPPVRVEKLVEALEVLRLLLDRSVVRANFVGRHHKLKDALNYPKPVQQHIPVWIGADKPRMLRLAAKYSDVVNLNTDPEGFRTRSDLLAEMEDKEGRKIQRSLFTRVVISTTDAKAKELFDSLLERELQYATSIRDKSSILKKWIVGGPEECVEKLEQYEKAGATSAELGFVCKEFPNQQLLELFCDKVVSKF